MDKLASSTPLPSPVQPADQSGSLNQSQINQSSQLDTSEEAGDRHVMEVKISDLADDERTLTSSQGYSETWEEYSSPRKSILASQMSTHRSRESGRLSPAIDKTSVEIGIQPLTLPRFNEPLKLRKGRQFVDYETQAPTVVYVPNRSFAHGRWTNVTVERKNGRYVVIEQRPIHTEFTAGNSKTKNIYEKDVFGHETSWTKKKAPWSWSSKENYIERSVNRRFYEPYLPPIKSKYEGVESKIGSLDNYYHQPGGGQHKVPSFKLKWDAQSKIGSLPPTGRDNYSSPGGSLKLPSISPRYGATADSGGSITSIHYTPGGKVFIQKNRNNAKSRIGSLSNMSHQPQGGDVSIPSNSTRWKKESKIGSLDNVTHLPKSSNVQIFSEKLDWKTGSKIGSLDNADHTPRRKRYKAPHFEQNWSKIASSKVGSLDNASHRPGGGNVQIIDQKLKWNAKPKIQSHWKMNFDYKSLFVDDDNDDFDTTHFTDTASFPYTV